MENIIKIVAEKGIERFVDSVGRSDVDALKREMDRLSSRAIDIENEIKIKEQSGEKKRKREVEDWLKMVTDLKRQYDELESNASSSRLPLIGDPVGKMQNRVKELIEQSNNFNELALDDLDNIGEPCLPTKLFGKKIKQNSERIWPCLVVDNISSIGIYGMGGVGKTTLARHLKYELEKRNYCVQWVTVSQEFSITSLQEKIANVMRIQLSNKDEEEMRANKLRKAFNKMAKLVLILDDVWEEFRPEQVGITLGANKCRLILTTRSSQVCDRMRCQRKFSVMTLDKSEAWDLFRHTLGHEIKLSPEVEEIAKSMASRCDGLPLGIITVAGSMRGVVDIREWRTALGQLESCSIGYKEMEYKVFPILEWSFNRLDRWEKLCFLHCCLYPEDYLIKREKLMDLVIWAELIPMWNTRERQYDLGHTIVNKLVKICLLEETKNRNGVECVKMHDLIRDMALRITSGKSSSKNAQDVPRFLVKSCMNKSNDLLIKNEEWIDDLFAVSLMNLELGRLEVPPLVSSNCRNLSTLIINLPGRRKIPDSFLQHMCRLEVLNLERCFRLLVLPKCISDMVNLKALLLENCLGLTSVPALGKLKQLRILNLFRTSVGDVPEGLEELENLERLYMSPSLRKRVLPEGTFSKLRRLQHLVLPAAVLIINPGVFNELQVYCGSGRLASLGDYSRLASLRHYEIVIRESYEDKSSLDDGPDDNDNFRDVDVDANAYVSRLKNKLTFTRCNFQNGLDVALLPEGLRELHLEFCSGLSDVFFHRRTDRSKDLVELNIHRSGELKFVLNFSSPDDERLQNLRRLSLSDLPNLVGLIKWSFSRSIPPETFSSLERLNIGGCDGLKKLFSVQLLQQSLQKLIFLCVRDCDELEEIVTNNNDEGKEEATSSGPIASAPQLLLPSLRLLDLSHLPRLKNICGSNNTIMIGDYYTSFTFTGCPQLKRLPSIKITSAGARFEIYGTKEWWNSLEWDNPTDKDALQPFFGGCDYGDYDFVSKVCDCGDYDFDGK